MRSTTKPRSSRAKHHRLRSFIARHLALWLMLFTLGGAVVLSSVLTGGRNESRKSAAVAGQKQERAGQHVSSK